MTDPVDLLIETARGEPTEEPFRVTGVMVQYYHACERELWFDSRHIDIDRENPAIVRGTTVDETAFAESRRNIRFGMIAIDLMDDGRIVEVKPSSELTEPARMQLAYYLWYLDRIVGIEKEGVLAHPREKRREPVELTDQLANEVEETIRGIYEVTRRDAPPPLVEKPYCPTCAYHDFCWS